MNKLTRSASTALAICLLMCSCTSDEKTSGTAPGNNAPGGTPDNPPISDTPKTNPNLDAPGLPQVERAKHPPLTSTECQQIGGTIEGDPGDGRTHRPDYRCANGEYPVGFIRPDENGPIAIEGAVCCPG